MKTNFGEKFETMFDYVEWAEITHYSMSKGAIPVWPGIVWVDAFKPREDSDFTVSDFDMAEIDEIGEGPLCGYVKVNWGEDHWCLLQKSALNDEVYARYGYEGGEFISDGTIYETEEKAWDGWKSVDEGNTPMIYDEEVTKEITNFIESANDIGVDDKGYIWMEDFGYFEDIGSLTDEMNHRRGKGI